jgi:predicted component of type VI protein secretion system
MQSKGSYRLTVQAGPLISKAYELVQEVNTIGRDLKNDIAVNDAEVSRTHTRLTQQGDGFLVEDLMSTNGTYVNGQRLSAAKVLRPGDLLGLGETVTLRLDFAPEAEIVTASVGESPAAASAPPTIAASQMGTGPLVSDSPADEQPRKRSWLFYTSIGCGCLTLIACAILIPLAIFLWNAPGAFWQSLGLG